MADKKISELNALASADSADELAIVDDDVGETKKITYGNLTSGFLTDIAGEDLSTADNSTSAFITLGDLPSIPTSVDDLNPSQTGNNGKFLTTDGTNASWAALPGGGDMAAATYDPTSVVGDAFDMDNMAQGSTNFFVTAGDITNLGNLDSAAYAATTDFAPALGEDDNYVTDAEKIIIGNTSGSNSGDQTAISDFTGTSAEFDSANTDGNFAFAGGAFHDGFSDFVANEHIDWTQDQGATNIHAGNYTNTTLTDEQVQDKVGAMVTGNTETLITVTYQDGDGTLDFVVDNDLSHYSNTTSGFLTAATVEAQVDHTNISNIGSNTHAQIDTHIGDSSDPHGAILSQTNITSSGVSSFAIAHITGDQTVAETAYVPNVIFDTSSSGITASTYPQGTLMVIYS